MKEYYVVVTTFDDRGRVTANIVDIIKSKTKPEPQCRSTRNADIYTDCFETLEEAKKFVEEAKIV